MYKRRRYSWIQGNNILNGEGTGNTRQLYFEVNGVVSPIFNTDTDSTRIFMPRAAVHHAEWFFNSKAKYWVLANILYIMKRVHGQFSLLFALIARGSTLDLSLAPEYAEPFNTILTSEFFEMKGKIEHNIKSEQYETTAHLDFSSNDCENTKTILIFLIMV